MRRTRRYVGWQLEVLQVQARLLSGSLYAKNMKAYIEAKLRTQAKVREIGDRISKGRFSFSRTRTRAGDAPQDGRATSSLVAL